MKLISKKARHATITLYNYVSTTNGVATYQRTVLSRVYLDIGYAQRLSQRGVSTTDNAQIIVDLRDLETTDDRTYLPFNEWKALTDKSGYFTLSCSNDFFVQGDIADTLPLMTKATMQGKYQCFSISSVAVPDSNILQILGK